MDSTVGTTGDRIGESEVSSTELTQSERQEKKEKSLKTTRSHRWMGQ